MAKSKEAQSKASRKHYENNRQAMIARAMKFKDELKKSIRQYIQDLKSSTPCKDCEVQYPYYVMHFDHLPEFEKKFDIGNSSKWTSMKKVLDEMEKCEIVCANCHAERTHRRAVV